MAAGSTFDDTQFLATALPAHAPVLIMVSSQGRLNLAVLYCQYLWSVCQERELAEPQLAERHAMPCLVSGSVAGGKIVRYMYFTPFCHAVTLCPSHWFALCQQIKQA